MSTEAFPVLYFNMCSEMMYIIEQRLTAQSIDISKANKVINDILLAIFNPELVCEVFKRQQLLNLSIVRQMFEKLVHSSIMKLNEQSMNKLFDLMIMVFKHQMVACNTAIDIIDITLNHLNTMRKIAHTEHTIKLIHSAKELFVNYYANHNWAELQLIRYNILALLQDIKTRVSIFLRDGTQDNTGTFVIKPQGFVTCECQIPGTIRYFNDNDEIIESFSFNSGGNYIATNEKTKLGFNIYTKEYSQKDSLMKQTFAADVNSKVNAFPPNEPQIKENAAQELSLLAKLIGRQQINESEHKISFWLNLGTNESIDEELKTESASNSTQINLTPEPDKNNDLENIINDLTITENELNAYSSNEDNLLELMDS